MVAFEEAHRGDLEQFGGVLLFLGGCLHCDDCHKLLLLRGIWRSWVERREHPFGGGIECELVHGFNKYNLVRSSEDLASCTVFL